MQPAPVVRHHDISYFTQMVSITNPGLIHNLRIQLREQIGLTALGNLYGALSEDPLQWPTFFV